jgi:hypothetical protein
MYSHVFPAWEIFCQESVEFLFTGALCLLQDGRPGTTVSQYISGTFADYAESQAVQSRPGLFPRRCVSCLCALNDGRLNRRRSFRRVQLQEQTPSTLSQMYVQVVVGLRRVSYKKL